MFDDYAYDVIMIAKTSSFSNHRDNVDGIIHSPLLPTTSFAFQYLLCLIAKTTTLMDSINK